MQRNVSGWLSVIYLVLVAAVAPATAQSPFGLRYKLVNPATNAQTGLLQGYSVAVDGDVVVTGRPNGPGSSEPATAVIWKATNGAYRYGLSDPRGSPHSRFGYSVAIAGSRVVVGAPWDDTGAENAGSVYVYDLASGAPTVPLITLDNPSPETDDHFGYSVSISGTHVVVGAPWGDTGAENSGTVYVYDLGSATPAVPVVTLENPGLGVDDYFGYSVSISGTRLLVGAVGAESAYLYDLAGATPNTPVATLHNPSGGTDDYFGNSVAISGTRAIVGAPFDDTAAVDAGRAYLYDLTSVTPNVPVATLNNLTPEVQDCFGYSVAISGTLVVIGAPLQNAGTGKAWVYQTASATPTLLVLLSLPLPDQFDGYGWSVAINGTRVVVGSPYPNAWAQLASESWVYDVGGATPATPIASLFTGGTWSDDYFAHSVAVSGTHVAVLSYGQSSIYIYDVTSSPPTWSAIKLPEGDAGYLAMSGTRLVVGAASDSTGAKYAGRALVYDLASPAPTVPVVILNNPHPAFYDNFGNSVAISGARVVVGELRADTEATDAGQAYVYDLASSTPTVPVVTLTNPVPTISDGFGLSVAISGTRVGVVAFSGVYVYDLASVRPSNPIAVLQKSGDPRGRQVTISGTRVVVGASFENGDVPYAGNVYVYDLSSPTPTVPLMTLDNPMPAAFPGFGASVALSGARLVVGAFSWYFQRYPPTGMAYVYDLASATPTVPIASLANPKPHNDGFGSTVAIDGPTIIVGAPYDHSTAVVGGAAFVFGSINPSLHIAAKDSLSAMISWMPADSAGFVLQFSDSLAPDSWVNAPSGATNPVNVSSTNRARFYRLFSP